MSNSSKENLSYLTAAPNSLVQDILPPSHPSSAEFRLLPSTYPRPENSSPPSVSLPTILLIYFPVTSHLRGTENPKPGSSSPGKEGNDSHSHGCKVEAEGHTTTSLSQDQIPGRPSASITLPARIVSPPSSCLASYSKSLPPTPNPCMF